MSVRYAVPAIAQASPMSCWWACTRMILRFHGRHPPAHPLAFSPRFERPWNLPLHSFTTESQPWDWYERGVPPNGAALSTLCDIIGFRPVGDRPAFGHWTLANLEAVLTRVGPFIFIGNWNRQGFHAVVVNGRQTTTEEGATTDEVIYIDPAMGMEISVSIDYFNQMMSSLGAIPQNPIYHPGRPPSP